MCALSVRFVLLIKKPYKIPRIVSLPSKSVRERFRTFFDILEDFAGTLESRLPHLLFTLLGNATTPLNTTYR